MQERAASHPHRAYGAEAGGQKFISPTPPFLFARLLKIEEQEDVGEVISLPFQYPQFLFSQISPRHLNLF